MSDETPEVVERARTTMKEHVRDEEVPFLRTCPVCNAPLRADGCVICFVTESYNGRSFDTISHYCSSCIPEPSDVKESLLTSYVVTFRVRIHEKSPDCDPSERQVSVVDIEYGLPDAYNL